MASWSQFKTRGSAAAIGFAAGIFALGLGDAAWGAPVPAPRAFLESSAKEYGEFGQRAAEFLVKDMPEHDRQMLTADFLLTNLRLAMIARGNFSWAQNLPEERFFNDVLPYAVLDETREPWRAKMSALAEGLVKDCRSASEAAQVLNRELFNAIKVHYDTSRRRPNQSPGESIAQGRATCTGLAILLVDACRSVGIPARVAGVAEWSGKPGNHTWVEIWDGGWKFMGADEFDPQGLDRGWFVEDASKAVAGDPRHAVWASSWKPVDGHFPLAWDAENKSVGAVNVTARYAAKTAPASDGKTLVHLRVTEAGPRIVVTAELLDARGRVVATEQTRAGTADLNDLASFRLEPGRYAWRLSRNNETRPAPLVVETDQERIVELRWEDLTPPALTKDQAEEALAEAWRNLPLEQRKQDLAAKSFSIGDKVIHWAERVHGDKPAGGYSLWISLHGGGNAPSEINDAQFRNQIDLYQPDEGIWVVPRAPTDTWNLWHEPHVDPMFDRIIEDYIVLRGVNPNRVYLLGYSAGGDGVYQLAPRMADRFAAAAMMAGHPNESSPLGLRNLPFAIFVGGADAGYHRNQVAREWGDRLDALQKSDPAGYTHWLRIYEGLGHWMNRRDAEALPWMAKFAREPWPKKVVWHQDDVTHDRFYWLALPPGVTAKKDQTISAEVNGQTIAIAAEGLNQIELRLSDSLLDLDRPVIVVVNGRKIFHGSVPRTRAAIEGSLSERADLATASSARLDLKW